MSRLEEHRAIVTGAGNGIGRAIAKRLAAEGARVVVNDLSGRAAQVTADAINQSGGTAVSVEGDISTEAGVEANFSLCEKH